jgi:hypothetical protein
VEFVSGLSPYRAFCHLHDPSKAHARREAPDVIVLGGNGNENGYSPFVEFFARSLDSY